MMKKFSEPWNKFVYSQRWRWKNDHQLSYDFSKREIITEETRRIIIKSTSRVRDFSPFDANSNLVVEERERRINWIKMRPATSTKQEHTEKGSTNFQISPVSECFSVHLRDKLPSLLGIFEIWTFEHKIISLSSSLDDISLIHFC